MQIGSTAGTALGLVSVTGFAIQQLLQLLDPLVEGAIGRYKARRQRSGRLALPNNMSEAEFKKSVMTAAAFGAGLLVSGFGHLRVLALLAGSGAETTALLASATAASFFDVLISGFVLGAGTDGVNTLLKYVGYVKDARGAAALTAATPPTAPPLRQVGTGTLPYAVAGTSGKISVRAEPGLGGQGRDLAMKLLARADAPYQQLEQWFGTQGKAVDVTVCGWSAARD